MSATLEVPPWSHSPIRQYSSTSYGGVSAPQEFGSQLGTHGRSVSDDISTSQLIRVATGLSTSTDQTTGSFHRILGGYSDAYIRSVKKLVKRYTAPTGQDEMGMSPMSDIFVAEPTWVNDPDASSVFNTRPFPLPGDFLNVDVHLQSEHPCFPESDEHRRRWCMCHAQIEAPDSTWVTAKGPSPYGRQLISGTILGNVKLTDAFGNTMLHFLAARGPEHMLIQFVQDEFCAPILNARNSAGQTFLHVLGEPWFQNLDGLIYLLDLLLNTELAQQRRFEINACDHYGRTFFHMLAAELPTETLQFFFQCYGGTDQLSRDAFGFQPMTTDPSVLAQAMEVDLPVVKDEQSEAGDTENGLFVIKDSRLIEIVRNALDNPALEDEDGRNGLHCLAMASLSPRSVMEKASSCPPTPQGRPKKRGKTPEEMLDSSEDRLKLRRSLVEGLLGAGVDPNHYDAYGNTPLMAFCAELPEDDDYKTGPIILERLLNHGANINARNRAGETALHIAVRRGRKLAVKTLIDRNANVHVRDAAGRSLLELADVKMKTCKENVPIDYCHYEACRAHLSGRGHAVQEPTVLQEWGI